MGITKKALILGVVGSDVHVIGMRILERALREHGFNVISLGGMVPPEEFISAAVETDACAILMSSLSGYGELYARDFRKRCQEVGLTGIKLYMGGHIVLGEEVDWEQVESKFKSMGFDRVAPPGLPPSDVIRMLEEDLADA